VVKGKTKRDEPSGGLRRRKREDHTVLFGHLGVGTPTKPRPGNRKGEENFLRGVTRKPGMGEKKTLKPNGEKNTR